MFGKTRKIEKKTVRCSCPSCKFETRNMENYNHLDDCPNCDDILVGYRRYNLENVGLLREMCLINKLFLMKWASADPEEMAERHGSYKRHHDAQLGFQRVLTAVGLLVLALVAVVVVDNLAPHLFSIFSYKQWLEIAVVILIAIVVFLVVWFVKILDSLNEALDEN